MKASGVVVLDVGKTNAKLTLWDDAGGASLRRIRANRPAVGPGYRALDAAGIEAWLAETLREFAGIARVRAIVPVAHGAAAALVCDGALYVPPMDYEDEAGEAERAAYDRLRDPFAATGSPRLPQGLNLGFQLHRLEALSGPWPDNLQILPWPQYWAWRLSGVAACEATSLGCHSDLWRPPEGCASRLADARGWARRLGPLRRAGEPLGPVTAHWVERAGLPADCAVICGLHDSNAALLAARGHAEIAAGDATVLSTGTWFVAMRSPDPAAAAPELDEGRDCLVNVDVEGRPVPSARFMGGREAELIAGFDGEEGAAAASLVERLPRLVAAGVQAHPSFAPGMGPFPNHRGHWSQEPADLVDRRAALGLYLALMADASLDLIGSRERLLVEGRFAASPAFVRALAALRPDQQVHVSDAGDEVAYGALRLVDPGRAPPSPLTPVRPLDLPLNAYRDRWRETLAREPA